MSTTTLMSSAERQAAARDAYRQSLLDGHPLTGNEIGDRFGRSPRWGRSRIAEVHAETATTTARPNWQRLTTMSSPVARSSSTPIAASATNGRQPSAAPVAVPPAIRRTTMLAVLAVAVVAAVASFDHQRILAELVGESWRSWPLPVSVDGLVVAASMSLLVQRRAGQKAGSLACAALALGLGASLAANVVAADPSIVRPRPRPPNRRRLAPSRLGDQS